MTAAPKSRRISRRHGLRTAVAAAFALPLAARATTPAHASSSKEATPKEDTGAGRDGNALRVMSFNLRYASDQTPHSWAERRPVTRALLRREEPHLVGTQEGLYGQLKDIAADLPRRYDWIGTGRAGGSRDEFMAVFYDTERLTPAEFDHFWLSDQPSLIGSRSWGNTVIRMVTWIRFTDRRTGGALYHLNTHLDHQSQPSRERSAALITERLGALEADVPRVVTGDFNVPAHGNPVYDALLAGGGLTDTWDTAERRSKLYATFHGYKPLVPDGERIDWILASPGVRSRYAAVNTFSLDGQFPSDHLPVQAVLDL
ncbi:endonuclease/exonuclease/phosphatase family protein [Streptomyces daliensis]